MGTDRVRGDAHANGRSKSEGKGVVDPRRPSFDFDVAGGGGGGGGNGDGLLMFRPCCWWVEY